MGPKRERTALERPRGVDATAVLIENTVAVGINDQTVTAVDFLEVFGDKLLSRYFEVVGDFLGFALSEPYITAGKTAAAIPALLTLEAQPLAEPIFPASDHL